MVPILRIEPVQMNKRCLISQPTTTIQHMLKQWFTTNITRNMVMKPSMTLVKCCRTITSSSWSAAAATAGSQFPRQQSTARTAYHLNCCDGFVSPSIITTGEQCLKVSFSTTSSNKSSCFDSKRPIAAPTVPTYDPSNNQTQSQHQQQQHSPNRPSKSTRPRMTTSQLRAMNYFICDMDGVLYHLQRVIPGALDFIDWLIREKKQFLFLTNSSERSPRELREKLQRMGINVGEEHFYTSALATAAFLSKQKPNGSAFVIGQPGLVSALYDVGYSMNDSNPDYVVVGETQHYNYSMIETAVKLVRNGSRLIGTNCDITDKGADGHLIPACASLVKPIELASGKTCYFIGKPNPLIIRPALKKLKVEKPKECVIIGDRMDTDILAGIESEIRTCLVLTGVTSKLDVHNFAWRPDVVLPSLGHILQDDCEVDIEK